MKNCPECKSRRDGWFFGVTRFSCGSNYHFILGLNQTAYCRRLTERVTEEYDYLDNHHNINMNCNFSIEAVTDTTVFIVDRNGRKSVTNDAENVVSYLSKIHPHKKIIYRDSMNQWDELVHDFRGNFIKFDSYKGTIPIGT